VLSVFIQLRRVNRNFLVESSKEILSIDEGACLEKGLASINHGYDSMAIQLNALM